MPARGRQMVWTVLRDVLSTAPCRLEEIIDLLIHHRRVGGVHVADTRHDHQASSL
jgi:hypothetical protein